MLCVETRFKVFRATVLTTLVAVGIAQLLALWFYPISSGSTAYLFAPVIASVTAFPISYFIWTKARQNAVLSARLQHLLDRDRLTDTATRDFFFSEVSRHSDQSGVVLMVDIDNFKQVNDVFGHLAGDRIIRMVADALRAHVRERDIVCRFGGEEFVIFLLGASPGLAWEIAERLRKKIACVETTTEGVLITVSVSVGGSVKTPRENIERVIRRADACLYKAKDDGRNRTVVDWTGSAAEDLVAVGA